MNIPEPWPALDDYLAADSTLGFAFAYPSEYLESIAWHHADFDKGGDGHALSFVRRGEVSTLRQVIAGVSSNQLVPFAHADDGDSLCCFDAADATAVYVVNLAERRPSIKRRPETDYLSFLNAHRANCDLGCWSSKRLEAKIAKA